MKIRLITIPNLLTLANMMCGILAIISTLVLDNMEAAFVLLIIAALFDFFDGMAARALNQPSPLGTQLDSLSDVVSFGVAPAIMMIGMWQLSPSLWGVPDALGYVLLAVAATRDKWATSSHCCCLTWTWPLVMDGEQGETGARRLRASFCSFCNFL